MKRTILSAVFALGTLAFTGPVSFADHHCTCDKECTEKCEKGEHKSCACKTCDCGHGKACKHGQCSHEHSKGTTDKTEKTEKKSG